MLRNKRAMLCGISTAWKILTPLMLLMLLTACKSGTTEPVNALCPKPLFMPPEVLALMREQLSSPDTPQPRKEQVAKYARGVFTHNCKLAVCRGEDLTGCGG